MTGDRRPAFGRGMYKHVFTYALNSILQALRTSEDRSVGKVGETANVPNISFSVLETHPLFFFFKEKRQSGRNRAH